MIKQLNCVKVCNKKIYRSKWFLSGAQYSGNKDKRFKTLILRSDLCGYSDVYIVAKGRITIESINIINQRANEKLTFKNNGQFRPCLSEINNIFIDKAEDLDIVMSVYNLLEYSDNYSITSRSFWNYLRDQVRDVSNENDGANYRVNNNKTTTSKSFEYSFSIKIFE